MKISLLFLATSILALDRSKRDIASQNRLANNRDRHLLIRRDHMVALPTFKHQIASQLNLKRLLIQLFGALKNNNGAEIRKAQSLFHVLAQSDQTQPEKEQNRRLHLFLDNFLK